MLVQLSATAVSHVYVSLADLCVQHLFNLEVNQSVSAINLEKLSKHESSLIVKRHTGIQNPTQ